MLIERYRKILEGYRPFVVATPWLQSELNLQPFGHAIDPEHIYSPIHMGTGPFLDLIQYLDSRCYGPTYLRMPRWAFYDCGELPGAIIGLGKKNIEVAPEISAILEVPDDYAGLVPLTMYIAIPHLGERHWLGHTICSIHEVIEGGAPMGSRRLTMALALSILRAKRVTSTTQWNSSKLHAHTQFYPLSVRAAWLPQHDEPATCVLHAEINDQVLDQALSFRPPTTGHNRLLDPTDHQALQALQKDIEDGCNVKIAGPTYRRGDATQIPLVYEEVAR